ncbi:MAG: hypothetical protein IJ446_08995 [Oscillospiraceae bacterium]|nr:hypothetical protein [Oscillospiraceae bacterium]
MKNNAVLWLDVYNAICNNETPCCPKCSSNTVKHEFRAKEDKIGFASFSCDVCGEEFVISRIKFSENVKTLPL